MEKLSKTSPGSSCALWCAPPTPLSGRDYRIRLRRNQHVRAKSTHLTMNPVSREISNLDAAVALSIDPMMMPATSAVSALHYMPKKSHLRNYTHSLVIKREN